MDSLLSVFRLMTPQCYMATIDLQDAYYLVPIAEEHRESLRFTWHGHLDQFTCMPNGLACAPRFFAKLMTPVYSTLRRQPYLHSGYIDDSYLKGQNFEECQRNVEATLELFTRLGFIINRDKSDIHPTQIITHLGFILNSTLITATLTLAKKEKMKDVSLEVVQESTPTITKLPQVIGILVSSFPGVQFGQLHYRTLEMEKNAALKSNKGNFDAVIALSSEGKAELKWWIDNVDKAYNPVMHDNPEVEIHTDASNTGWGGSMC